MAHARVLIVDDEALVRWSLKERLARDGYELLEADTAAAALEQARYSVDLVLLDFRLPDSDGFAVLTRVRDLYPEIPVIMMTAYSTIDHAVEAMKAGAFHYIHKPFNVDEVALLVAQALDTSRLRRQVRALRTSAGREYGFDAIVGLSPAMQTVRALLERIAMSPASTVLLTGETGTGKDLAAKVIHYNSDRAAHPFVTITCSALPEPLLESELFGHERGAFTDAHQQKRGMLEIADRGTVFLDEIGEMTPPLQAKLLRFLEDRAFARVGGLQDIHVDVRVIAASHRNLEQLVGEGRFRQDLFYRLQVMPVALPPLRERRGDIALLAAYYIGRYNGEFGKKVEGLSGDAQQLLERYSWPGNVRELRNAIERAMLLIDRSRIEPDDLAGLSRPAARVRFRLPPEGVKLDEVERELLVQALERTRGNQTHAGQLVGINRDQVRYRIEKFGLQTQTGK